MSQSRRTTPLIFIGPRGKHGKHGKHGKKGDDGLQGPTGPIGPAGPAGPPLQSILTNQTYYVDAVYGNDGTGQPFERDLPYQTITAAMTAAIADGGPSTIHVWPGTYTDAALGQTGAELIEYFFEEGVILNPNAALFPNVTDLVVRGSAVINDNGAVAPNTAMLSSTQTTTLVFECRSIVWNAGRIFDINAAIDEGPTLITVLESIYSEYNGGVAITDQTMAMFALGSGGEGSTITCPLITRFRGSVFRTIDLGVNPGLAYGWDIRVGSIALQQAIGFLGQGNTPIHAIIGEVVTDGVIVTNNPPVISAVASDCYFDLTIGNTYFNVASDPSPFVSAVGGEVHVVSKSLSISSYVNTDAATMIGVTTAFVSVSIDEWFGYAERIANVVSGSSTLKFDNITSATISILGFYLFTYADGTNSLSIKDTVDMENDISLMSIQGGIMTGRINSIIGRSLGASTIEMTPSTSDITVDLIINSYNNDISTGFLLYGNGLISGHIHVGTYFSQRRVFNIQDSRFDLVVTGDSWVVTNDMGVSAIATDAGDVSYFTFDVGTIRVTGANVIAGSDTTTKWKFKLGRIVGNAVGFSWTGAAPIDLDIGYAIGNSVIVLSGAVVTHRIGSIEAGTTSITYSGNTISSGTVDRIFGGATGVIQSLGATGDINLHVGIFAPNFTGINVTGNHAASNAVYVIDHGIRTGAGNFYVGASAGLVTFRSRRLDLNVATAFNLSSPAASLDASITDLVADFGLVSASTGYVRFHVDYAELVSGVASLAGTLNNIILEGHYRVSACITSLIDITVLNDGLTVSGVYADSSNSVPSISAVAAVLVRFYSAFSNRAYVNITPMIAGSDLFVNANVQ